MFRRTGVSFLIVALIFGAQLAIAADQTACPPMAATCPSTAGPINADTAIPVAKGSFVLNPVFFHSFSYGAFGNFTPGWKANSAHGRYRSALAGLRFYYGAAENLEIYGLIPFAYNYANRVGPYNGSADFGGIGDLQFFVKYQFVQENEVRPAVSALFGIGIPTGHYRRLNPARFGTDLLGAGSWRFTAGLNASKYAPPFILYGNIWYTVGTDFSTDAGGTYARFRPRDQLAVNFAAELPFGKKWTACADITSTWDVGRVFGRKANTAPTAKVTVTPELQYKVNNKFSVAGGVGFDVLGKNSRANITPQLSFYYRF